MRYSMDHSAALVPCLVVALLALAPASAFAQASPWLTGATSLQSNIYSWGVPIAVIGIMVLGIMAISQRLSWGTAVASMLGIVIFFGSPTLVTWVRGMFGV